MIPAQILYTNILTLLFDMCAFRQIWHRQKEQYINPHYNMTVWILARNDINFSMAAGLIRLHMPGVK